MSVLLNGVAKSFVEKTTTTALYGTMDTHSCVCNTEGGTTAKDSARTANAITARCQRETMGSSPSSV